MQSSPESRRTYGKVGERTKLSERFEYFCAWLNTENFDVSYKSDPVVFDEFEKPDTYSEYSFDVQSRNKTHSITLIIATVLSLAIWVYDFVMGYFV